MSDTVYREDAINSIYKLKKTVTKHPKDVLSYCDGLSDALESVQDLPSADRPQGEWVDAEIPLESGDTMPIQVCNLCKTFYPLAYTGGGHRFCPNCGARMLVKDINVPNKKGADDGRR